MMFRSALAVLLVALLPLPALAEGQPLHVTATGGVVFSKLRDVTAPFGPFGSIKAFAGGIGLTWPFASAFELEPRLTFTEKGISLGEFQKYDVYGMPLGTFETFLVAGYLEVPVLLRWVSPQIGRVHVVAQSGPFVSLELSERMKYTGSVQASGHESLLKNPDWGLVLGGGLQLDAGPGRWLLEGHYERGMRDLGNFFGTEQVHSEAFVISTGYRY